jgi:hypothetical protein
MASLLNLKNGEVFHVMTQGVIGRNSSLSNIILNNPKVSRRHAILSWGGEGWLLQDTSTNGTYVNGVRLPYNAPKRLKQQDKISFADSDAGIWQVENLDPPKSLHMPAATCRPVGVIDDNKTLSNKGLLETTLYLTPEGDWGGVSQTELKGSKNKGSVRFDGRVWYFAKAISRAETACTVAQPVIGLSDINVHFKVSRNEEHVSLQLNIDNQRLDLGERIHHYLLLLLARQAMEDQAAGIEPSEQGWANIEQLIKMLKLTENHINMHICRFRQQVLKSVPDGVMLPQMIERRKCEIRFMCGHVHIDGGMVQSVKSF